MSVVVAGELKIEPLASVSSNAECTRDRGRVPFPSACTRVASLAKGDTPCSWVVLALSGSVAPTTAM